MPASEARIAANRKNAARSTGPKTPEGKAASRANSYKHGMTGSGIVVPEGEAAEVAGRTDAFEVELDPSGEVGLALVRHAARLSVRMDRCAEHAATIELARVRRALTEFVPPEGSTPKEADRLRAEAATLAFYDPPKEAVLARKYERAAEHGFFRALRELRLVEAQAKARETEERMDEVREVLASFSPSKLSDTDLDAEIARLEARMQARESSGAMPAGFEAFRGRTEVPIAIGKRH